MNVLSCRTCCRSEGVGGWQTVTWLLSGLGNRRPSAHLINQPRARSSIRLHISHIAMAGFFATPPTLHGTHLSTVPRELYADATSDWAPDASIVHLNPPLIALPLSPQHCLLTTGNGPTPPIFLEGITTDTQGIIFVVDIPYGRILRLDLAVFSPPSCCTTPHDPPSSAPHPGQPLTSSGWSIATTFKGNPNGLALTGEGRIAIADYAEGILVYDPATGTVNPHLTRRNLERFKGPNDLIVASNGDLCAYQLGRRESRTGRKKTAW